MSQSPSRVPCGLPGLWHQEWRPQRPSSALPLSTLLFPQRDNIIGPNVAFYQHFIVDHLLEWFLRPLSSADSAPGRSSLKKTIPGSASTLEFTLCVWCFLPFASNSKCKNTVKWQYESSFFYFFPWCSSSGGLRKTSAELGRFCLSLSLSFACCDRRGLLSFRLVHETKT